MQQYPVRRALEMNALAYCVSLSLVINLAAHCSVAYQDVMSTFSAVYILL